MNPRLLRLLKPWMWASLVAWFAAAATRAVAGPANGFFVPCRIPAQDPG
jgi:hypothetical protein